MVEDEIMIVTNRSGSTLTVIRGQEGTAAAAHGNLSAIALYVTGGSIDKIVSDCYGKHDVPLNRILESNTSLTVSDFTWVNQGSATVADDGVGGAVITMPGEAGHNLRGLVRSVITAPWTLTMKCDMGIGTNDFQGGDGSHMGIMLRETSNGRLITCSYRTNGNFAMWRWTNTTTFNANIDTARTSNNASPWIRLEDDDTNLLMSISDDGANWTTLWSDPRASFLSGGPDQFGFYAASGGGVANTPFHFHCWIAE